MSVFLEAGRGRCPELLPHRDQTDGGEIHRDPGVHREGTEPPFQNFLCTHGEHQMMDSFGVITASHSLTSVFNCDCFDYDSFFATGVIRPLSVEKVHL